MNPSPAERNYAFGLLTDNLACLQNLTPQQILDARYILMEFVSILEAGPHHTLYEQDTDVTTLYLIVEGSVYQARTETDQDGNRRRLLRREVGPGTLLARYDLLYSQQYSTFARTRGVSRLVAIEAPAFNRLIYHIPNFRLQLAPLDTIARLRTIPYLGELDITALSFVADKCKRKGWEAGEQIYQAHDAADCVYLVDRGQVKLSWPGRESWLSNGAAFGYLNKVQSNPSATGGYDHDHSAVATIETTTFTIPRQTLIETAGINPEEVGIRHRQERETMIQRLPIFANLSSTLRQKLVGYTGYYHIPNRHLLMQQGEIGDSLWLLMPHCRATIHALDTDGERLPSTPVVGPIYFSELALRIQRELRSTVEAEQNSQWMRLHWRDFQAFLRDEKNPGLAKQLVLSEEVSEMLDDDSLRERAPWLQDGEELALFTRRHWIVLLRKLVNSLLAVSVLIIPVLLLTLVLSSGPLLTTLWIVGVLAGAVALFWAWLDYRNDFLVGTNQRIARQEKLLFITEWRQEAFLEQIQNIDTEVTFWGNVFGYGDVSVQTAGATGAIIFNYAPNPDDVKQKILSQQSRREKTYHAEGRKQIQDTLESRLGMKLDMPSRVYDDRETANLTEPKNLIEHLRRRMSTRQLTGDRIIWRKHWAVLVGQLFWPLMLLALCIIVLIGAFGLLENLQGLRAMIEVAATIAALIVLAWIAWIIADWHNDTYEVGKSSVVDVSKKPLFVSEHRRTARLGEIENVEFDIPGPLHYLLNYGNVKLQTAATEGNFTFDWVPDPRNVTAEINRRIHAYHREEELRTAEDRAEQLPDWFETYNRLNAEREARRNEVVAAPTSQS